MTYKIIIQKKTDNVNYAAEVAKYEERYCGYNPRMDENYPQKEVISDALICELTEDQYKAIKAAVFNTFQ